MTYDPCNPPKIIHHTMLGRFKHYRHRGGVHHSSHPYHHIVANGCPKTSVLDIARFGPLPAAMAKLAPIGGIVVAGGLIAGGAISGYQGGYFGGGGGYVGGGGSGSTGFVCTKYTQHDKRCEHVTQVPEPSSILCLLVGVVVIFLSRKRLLSI